MRITESRIRRIIREEISSMIDEWDEWGDDDEPRYMRTDKSREEDPEGLGYPEKNRSYGRGDPGYGHSRLGDPEDSYKSGYGS